MIARDLSEEFVPLDPGRPLLATGLAAFLLANGVGDLSLLREPRGAVLDWGGPYALGVHLTGPWTVRYRKGLDGGWESMPAKTVTRHPGGFEVTREGSGLRVSELAGVHPTRPCILLHRTISAPSPTPATV